MASDRDQRLAKALWRVFRRPDRPIPWARRHGNLPWDDPAFSERMLREHLDESHGAASRNSQERAMLVDWLWRRLSLDVGQALLDVTCGPGLYATVMAERGCTVTGVDFSPASIRHARELAHNLGVAQHCRFVEADVRHLAQLHQDDAQLPAAYDAATLLYGQLAVFPPQDAQQILSAICRLLKPAGKLCVVLLDPERIDRKESTWWYTDDSGLWGEGPYLHLGERLWDETHQLSIERFQIIHLESGEMDEVHLCDQLYTVQQMTDMFHQAGFAAVQHFPAWDGLPLYDAQEWVVYLATT
jgi:SAM-dependent methyltransferase